jgi:hypothetical protein
MKNYQLFFFAVAVCLLMASMKVSAQCCAAGNPLSIAPEVQRSGKNELKVSALYRLSASDTYYDVDRPIDISYVDQSGFHYTELGIEYGFLEHLSFKVELGYFMSKFETYLNPDFDDKVARGLADMNLIGRVDLLRQPSKSLHLSATAGIKLPVGLFDLTVDNVRFPVQLQPSSGSFRYHGGLVLAKGLFNRKLTSISGVNIEYSKRIQSKNFDYKYGTVYNLFVGGAYKLGSGLSAILQFQGEFRAQSKRENEQLVEASGGTILSVVPQLNYSFNQGWNAHLAFSVPLYRHYNSIQLGSKYAFSLFISKTKSLKTSQIFIPDKTEALN